MKEASMAFDWTTLRSPAPATLAPARKLAHYAAQWATRAARGNRVAAPDDSHSSLSWDARAEALVSQTLPGALQVGLQLAEFDLVILRGGRRLAGFELAEQTPAAVDAWLDDSLKAAGLKPASGAALPYE